MSFTPLVNSSFGVIRKVEEEHCCAGPCFPCLRRLSEKAIYQLVKEFGENAEADAEHEHLDFSLLRGSYIAPFSSETVELEYTRAPADDRDHPYDDDISRAKQLAAVERLRKLYQPVLPLGFILYALLLGGGYWSGLYCDCSGGPTVFALLIPALAIFLQVWGLNRITILLSQTEIEGRPLLRLLRTLTGLDNYYVMTLLSLLDTFSRFTRAQFVGYIAHCHAGVDKPFAEVFEAHGWLSNVGIAELAQLSFITGPICIQFGYMLHLRHKLNRELKEAEERLPGQDMEVTDSIDDLAALMNWALLIPAGKVLEMAALPINLDGPEDAERLWDGIKTKVYVYLARDIPDGIMQMNLQAIFFCLVFQRIGWSVRLQLLLNILLAGGTVVVDAFELVFMNRRMTVLAGFTMLVLVVAFGGARTAGAFLCDSAITGLFLKGFECLPVGQVDMGNWTSGELPG
mmetsp:Transcript_55039/g.160634  ORF Transcript_55039/g.160634 Transcript_55039/m.160634 type:complete len:458 (+) Transcript_55039:61-1434(+)